MLNKQKNLVLLWVILFSLPCVARQEAFQLNIELDEPTFVLPQFSGPYMEREASIAPEEYEMAETLQTLLQEKNKEQVLAKLDEFYSIELSPAMLALKGQVYFALKMFDEAEYTYLQVLKRKPQLMRVHVDLGQLYLVLGRSAEARKYLARAVSLGSNDATVHGQLAYLNLTTFSPFSAISEYQQAMALEPENTQWQQGLLAALTQARMFEATNALVMEMLERQPLEKSLWLAQAAVALELEDKQRALQSLEMAILLGESSPQNFKTAAKLHLQQHSYARAFELIALSLQDGSPEMRVVGEYLAWLEATEMYDQQRKLLQQIEPTIAAYSLEDRGIFYFHEARLAHRMGDASGAETWYKRSLDANGADVETLLAYGALKKESRKFVEAELLFVRAMSVDGGEKKGLLALAQLFVETKDYKAALANLKAAYLKYPELTDVRDNIDILERILKNEGGTQI